VGSIASSFIPPNPFAVSPNEEERSALDAHARPGLEKRDMVQSMSSGRPAALGSIMSTLEQRRDQMFPKLRPEEIDRLRRFGEIRRYAPGELLFVTGEPSPGMFVLIAGNGCRQRPGRFGTCGPNRRRRTGRVPRRSSDNWRAAPRSLTRVQRPRSKRFSFPPSACAASSSRKLNSAHARAHPAPGRVDRELRWRSGPGRARPGSRERFQER
jgi:hypothetical protein